MQVNLPSSVRLVLYILTGLSAILVTYLSAVGQIGPEAVTAFGATTALVSGLAGYNVNK